MTTPTPRADAGQTEPVEQDAILGSSLDDFIFHWFNERDPDSMRECLDAHHERELSRIELAKAGQS